MSEQSAIAAALPETIGNYYWSVLFSDGEVFSQFQPGADNRLAEVSIDVVHAMETENKRATHIVMQPKVPGVPQFVLEIPQGFEWHKKWIRTFEVSFEDGTQRELPIVEALGLRMPGLDVWIWCYVYLDGTVRVTSSPEA